MKWEVSIEGKTYGVELIRRPEGREWLCRIDGREVTIDAAPGGRDVLSLVIDGKSYEIKREGEGSSIQLTIAGERYAAEVRDPRSYRARSPGSSVELGPKKLVAPMSGKVVRVLAPVDSPVEAGQGVLVIEAMKMQNEIKSPKAGRVRQILAAEGQAVNAGEVVAVVE